MKCDFDNCTNEAEFLVEFPDGHIRYICKEHILHRLEKICEKVSVERLGGK